MQESTIQLSKWKVIFFFIILLFGKCLLGIAIAHRTAWIQLKRPMSLILPCWGSLCLWSTCSLPMTNLLTPWAGLLLGTALSVVAVQWFQMIFPSREMCSEDRVWKTKPKHRYWKDLVGEGREGKWGSAPDCQLWVMFRLAVLLPRLAFLPFLGNFLSYEDTDKVLLQFPNFCANYRREKGSIL